MPKWDGKWKGGRFYRDPNGRPVFFIESNRDGIPGSIRLKTQDEKLAESQLADFRADPHGFCARFFAEAPVGREPFYITTDRINLYLAGKRLRKASDDHRTARAHYLTDWSAKELDLLAVSPDALRVKLAEFAGGHNGRAEALNAFARFFVKRGELPKWVGLECEHDPQPTRAERRAYSVEELRQKYQGLGRQDLKDVFRLRLFAAGMHHTEIEQLEGAKVYEGPLPDRGACIRVGVEHPVIAGVLQFRQKTKVRHRVSVTKDVLEAALRLVKGVPDRELVWEKFNPLTPSNLRHTFVTLAGEVGEWVTHTGRGVPLDLIQQVAGHRIGSKVTQSNYDKLQIPPMIRLPLELDILPASDGDLPR